MCQCTSINPGIIWSGRYCQFGVEALIPVNARSGSRVGVLGQLHFYLDDLFPRTLGRPLFGGGNNNNRNANPSSK